jgi:hypothetical protein
VKIIDAHAHIYPAKIAAKASQAVGEFYDLPMSTYDATAEVLLSRGTAAGVEGYVVCGVATRPEQVARINDFIGETIKKYPQMKGLATLHPEMSAESLQKERARIDADGFSGVKLHPDFQKFNADEPNFIYEACRGLRILFHAGDKRYDYSAPARIAKVAVRYPDITCIAAHFGGYSQWDEVGVYAGLDNVYFDTSSSLRWLPLGAARKIIDKYGADRIMFGSDFPMWDYKEDIEKLEACLSAREKDLIFYQNAKKLFNF